MSLAYAIWSIEELSEILYHDAATGDLHWKVTIHPQRRKGTRADLTVSTQGYRLVALPGSPYLAAHRVIWALEYGYWPSPTVDHIDRNRQHNAIDNLREATMKQQMAFAALTPQDVPTGPKAGNKWGYSGVVKTPRGFQAECMRGGAKIRGPRRSTPKEAYDALVAKLAAL